MLAERIGVSASTASESIRKLADQGLVDHEKYGAVTLTEAGRARRAGDGAPAPADGDLPGSRARLQLGRGARRGRDPRARRVRPDARPHRRQAGTSHPRSARRSDPRRRRPGAHARARQLSVCQDGDTGTVARISDADPEMLRYFDSVGISLDSRLRVLARRDFAGMISVAIKPPTPERTIPARLSIWEALRQKRSGSSAKSSAASLEGRRASKSSIAAPTARRNRWSTRCPAGSSQHRRRAHRHAGCHRARPPSRQQAHRGRRCSRASRWARLRTGERRSRATTRPCLAWQRRTTAYLSIHRRRASTGRMALQQLGGQSPTLRRVRHGKRPRRALREWGSAGRACRSPRPRRVRSTRARRPRRRSR